MLVSSVCFAQQPKKADTAKKSNVTVTKVDSKTFKAVKQSGSSSRGTGYKPTGYQYIDTDGKTYEIYSHIVTKGENAGKTQYYIEKTSKKTGNKYWKKINIEM